MHSHILYGHRTIRPPFLLCVLQMLLVDPSEARKLSNAFVFPVWGEGVTPARQPTPPESPAFPNGWSPQGLFVVWPPAPMGPLVEAPTKREYVRQQLVSFPAITSYNNRPYLLLAVYVVLLVRIARPPCNLCHATLPLPCCVYICLHTLCTSGRSTNNSAKRLVGATPCCSASRWYVFVV